MRVLAIKTRRLGDTVLWTAALEALRQFYPGAEIDLVLPAAYASLFVSDDRFQTIFPYRDARSAIGLAKTLRFRRYDLALNFHASGTSRWLAIASGARERVIHHHDRTPRQALSQRLVPNVGIPMSAMERDLNVVRSLGWTGPAPKTRIVVGETLLKRGRERLEKLGSREAPWVFLGVTASRPSKQWPIERYAALARRLSQTSRVAVLEEAVPSEKSLVPLRRQLAEHANFLPTPNLEDLMGLLPQAKLYVGSDSGVKHLACALEVPTVTLFGPESRGEWHGYDEARHIAIQKPVGCRTHDPNPSEFAWCGEAICPLASHACMSLISVDEVASVATAMIR